MSDDIDIENLTMDDVLPIMQDAARARGPGVSWIKIANEHGFSAISFPRTNNHWSDPHLVKLRYRNGEEIVVEQGVFFGNDRREKTLATKADARPLLQQIKKMGAELAKMLTKDRQL